MVGLMRLPNPLAAYQRWQRRRAYDWWRREWYLMDGDPAHLMLSESEIDNRLDYAMTLIDSVALHAEEAAEGMRRMAAALR